MPIVYTHNGTMGASVNVSTFIRNAQVNPAGPLPGAMSGGGVINNLGTHQAALNNIGTASRRTRAIGLITCASVIYVSTSPAAVAGAWVHHANAGYVSAANVTTARAQLGNPAWGSIYVIFAHPGASDNGYDDSMTTIAAQGVPANNIIEIPNLIIPQFGINNLGQIGY